MFHGLIWLIIYDLVDREINESINYPTSHEPIELKTFMLAVWTLKSVVFTLTDVKVLCLLLNVSVVNSMNVSELAIKIFGVHVHCF